MDELEEFIRTTSQLLPRFEEEQHLPSGFLRKLLTEDDWSFVIKAHAVIEATVSRLLAAVLEPKLLSVFQRLGLGGKRTGKVGFAMALGLLSGPDIRFIQLLSQLRNDLAHDVARIDFTFKEYLKSLDGSEHKRFLDQITAFADNETKPGWLKNARNDPKTCIWLYCIRIVFSSSVSSMKAELDRLLSNLSRDRILTTQETEVPLTQNGAPISNPKQPK